MRYTVELELLKAAGPITAIEMADIVEIDGTHEHKRRAIRKHVHELRKHRNLMVCSSSADGYWIARDAAEYAAWQEAERRKEIFRWAEMKKNLDAVTDERSGQGKLFETGSLFDMGNAKGAYSK